MPFQIKFYCDCVIDNTILFHKHLLNTEGKFSSENKEEEENALKMASGESCTTLNILKII